MNETAKRLLKTFTDTLTDVDEITVVLLKGHLLIEELLTEIIQLHVYNHPYIDKSAP
jgi:hypothetical protein